MKNPASYFQANYWDLVGWSAALLALATTGAYMAASPKLESRFTNPFLSSWGVMFLQHDKQNVNVYVGCAMTDGSYVSGYLFSYSRLSEDLPDRDLTLTGDITYRPPEGDETIILDNVGGVILSARNISMLTVTYVDDVDVDNGESESAEDFGDKCIDSAGEVASN
jgi:hypothetical protein